MNPSKYKRQRAINFDLNGDALKEYYSESNPNGAYKDIERFMKNNGFIHRQWSGYCSKKPMTNFDLLVLFAQMYEKMPWLNNCVERMDATTIDSVFDIKEMMSKNMQERADRENSSRSQNHKNKSSVLARLAENKKLIEQKSSGQQEKMHHRETER